MSHDYNVPGPAANFSIGRVVFAASDGAFFDTNRPATLAFDESQRGKMLYFCLRWEGNTGLKGPYGEIYNTIVP
ncbi:MAG: hypothetical protein LBF50_09055 [Azoarcus sp.]|jgi:hypothetical protein|nr:hypothetical protein [Azoarcus sp.]